MVNKWYNGKDITEETLLDEFKECIEDKDSGDLSSYAMSIFKYIATTPYEGRNEDIDTIVERLNCRTPLGWDYPEANLQSVESIISKGNASTGSSRRDVKADQSQKNFKLVLNLENQSITIKYYDLSRQIS